MANIIDVITKHKQDTFNPETLKYFIVNPYFIKQCFGETPEGTGRAEDYRLKLSPRKASPQYEVLNKKLVDKVLNI